MTRTLGCDPGLTGAVALWDDALDMLIIEDTPVCVVQVGRSARRKVINDAEFARLVRALGPDRFVIEAVNGVKGQSASASFSFGASWGLLRGFAAMLAVPVHFIAPATWRGRLHVSPGKDGSRLRASQLFPKYSQKFARAKDDGRAEAALIALCPLSNAAHEKESTTQP